MKPHRLMHAILSAPVLLALSATQVCAQDYPRQTIKIVVPYAAGGGVDIIARLLGEQMHESLGRPVIVDNKPGASGMIGAQVVAKAAPDGYSLLMAAAGEIAVNPHLYRKMTYDPDRELAPVSLVVRVPNVLVVNPDVPAANVAELVNYARANPRKISYSSSGVGNPQHLAGEMLNRLAGIDIVHVPYKGAAQQLSDVIGKQVAMTFTSIAAALPAIKAGQVKALAVTTKSRVSALPQVPAIAEHKPLAAYELINWFGLFATAGTPGPVIGRLNDVVQLALKNPGMREKIIVQGGEPMSTSPEEFRQFVRTESAKFAKIIADANVTVEQ